MAAATPWAAFRSRPFAVIWTATVVANVGGWMYAAAAGWLMSTLTTSATLVAMVQVVTTLPMFLLALPAGAISDIVDRRKLLIATELLSTVAAFGFAVIVWLGEATAINLLVFTFVIGIGEALGAPSWQSIVPELVAKPQLRSAIAANSAGINVSRAVGPALGGLLTARLGLAAPFWVNAFANLATIGALLWWRRPEAPTRTLPPERFGSAIRTGLRHARSNDFLKATLVRAAAFFPFASAYWALLPVLVRDRIGGTGSTYGILLGLIGVGAVAGVFVLPTIQDRFGANRAAAYGTLGTAVAMLGFAFATTPLLAGAASLVAGFFWIVVLASLNVSAQTALPEWVRGRGLAVYVTTMFGTMTLGSLVWGKVASMAGLPVALGAAAILLALLVLPTRRFELQRGADVDLSPALHWPTPIVSDDAATGDRPVMVTVEYLIDPQRKPEFLAALSKLGHERRRDGAFAWRAFTDIADDTRVIELFLLESWEEHLRQHQRVTRADAALETTVDGFDRRGASVVRHYIQDA